jgi:hypothetical protein
MKKHISEYSATSSSQWSQGSNYSMMEHEIICIREWEGLECLMMDLAMQYLQRILAASHSGRKTVLKDVPMQTIGTVSSRTFEVKGEAPVSVLYCPKKFNYRGIEGNLSRSFVIAHTGHTLPPSATDWLRMAESLTPSAIRATEGETEKGGRRRDADETNRKLFMFPRQITLSPWLVWFPGGRDCYVRRLRLWTYLVEIRTLRFLSGHLFRRLETQQPSQCCPGWQHRGDGNQSRPNGQSVGRIPDRPK